MGGVAIVMDSSSRTKRYALPGRRASVSSRRNQLRSLVFGAGLFGPKYLKLLAAAHSGDPARLRNAERSWARSAARGAKLTVETHGLDYVDPQQQYVVVPLHEGFADVLALLRLPLDLTFSAAQELFDWRLVGRYLKASGHTSLPRTNGPHAYRTMIRAAESTFSRGESYVVFPQGSILGIETAFHSGAFHLAARTGKDILPIVLTGGATVWAHPFSDHLNFNQTVRLEVLKSVPPDEAVSRAREIETTMKDRALRASPGPRHFNPAVDGWWDDYPYEIDPRFTDLAARLSTHRVATIRTTTAASTDH